MDPASAFDTPLELRPRIGGERITLPGRTHSSELKHVLQALGVPPWERNRLPLLFAADGELLAAGDVALSARLQDWLRTERPYLGICLGYQLLFESGEESPGVAGLGRFRGTVPRFPARPGLKIPHMGWNTARFTDPTHPAWQGLGESSTFYFVHSFAVRPQDPADVLGTAEWGERFVCAVARPPLYGVQFHPEKSSAAGLRLLANFARICASVPV